MWDIILGSNFLIEWSEGLRRVLKQIEITLCSVHKLIMDQPHGRLVRSVCV